MKERLDYIDNARGLFMILVVFFHTSFCTYRNGISCEFFQNVFDHRFVYLNFFMPVFFIITGYCTNFQIGFGEFVKKKSKQLLVPLFCLGPIVALMKVGTKNLLHAIIYNSCTVWFLSALFFAFVVFYVIHLINQSKIKKQYLPWADLGICLFIGLLSVYVARHFIQYNVWNWMQGMILLPFIAVGQILKIGIQNRLSIHLSIVLSIIWLIIQLIYNIPVSEVTAHIGINYSGYALMLILSTVMTIAGFEFGKCFHSKIVCYIGQNSLVVYLFHIPLLYIISNVFREQLESASMAISAIYFAAFWSGSIVLSCCLAYVLNMKCFNWMLGKF